MKHIVYFQSYRFAELIRPDRPPYLIRRVTPASYQRLKRCFRQGPSRVKGVENFFPPI